VLVTNRHDSAYGSPDLAGRTGHLGLAQPLAECIGIDEVGERLLAGDLDDGQESAVARLELGVPCDVDEVELEAELGAGLGDDLDGAGAEAAVGGMIDGDAARYG
jgi:hypothetical protein